MVLTRLALTGISFGRNLIGIVISPYETYRRIVDRGSMGELIFLASLLMVYFATASLVKTAAFRPFLLTREFIVLSLGGAFLYAMVVVTLWSATHAVGGHGTLIKLALSWAYTLVPTVVWFFATSLLSVFLPPPRTASILGMAFSIVYLVFSAALFFWKVTLGYLTLRFSMRLDLVKIVEAAAICLPFLLLYAVGFYKLGIFKVPFI